MKTLVDKSRDYGNEILSTQGLGTEVSKLKWAIIALGVFVVTSDIVYYTQPDPKPLLLDTSTGNIITNYKTVLDGYTVQERALLAELAYELFRRRTGNKTVDEASINKWLGMFTSNGLEAWKNLGLRWADPNVIRNDFVRTLQVLSVVPDSSNEYAFIIEAIESESEENKPTSKKQFRVRLTLFFTDPKVEGVMKIDGVALHEDTLVK